MTDKLRDSTNGVTPGYEYELAPGPINPNSGQHTSYWILPEEERAKGFVRPVRTSYKHVGLTPPSNLRDLTDEEKERYKKYNYVKFEPYGTEKYPVVGMYWTQEMLDKIGNGCGTITTMSKPIAETYARDPGYYGSTFCTGCGVHLKVGEQGEFVWLDGTRVGS